MLSDSANAQRQATLSQDLFREVRPDFFRVLSGVNAPVYADALDALEQESSQRHEGMDREDALSLVTEVLSRRPDFQLELEEGIDLAALATFSLRDKARYVLDYFTRASWVEAETGADWRRVIHFNPHGSTLLTAARKIARPDAAVFTDKLVSVCALLANPAELQRQPWEHLQTCWDNARQGLAELRAMRKSIERFIRRQLETETLGDNLGVVFDQYAEQVGRTCYAELVRSQLANRLAAAQEHLRGLLNDADLLHKMQAEVLRREPSLATSAAMSRVRVRLDELGRALDGVIPLADQIDNSTAEFTRRSLARFRYLQEVVGERRGQMKELFELVNRSFADAGGRLSDLDDQIELPPLRLPETRLLAGRDSLYEPARRRTIEENAPLAGDVSEAQRENARRQMESALRDSLSVTRANHFISQLPGGKGSRISSGEFPVRNEDDLADLIAVLLHAESAEARYRIESPRVAEEGAEVAHDRKATCEIERFFVIKK
jgi:hypothetical protein